MHVANIVVGPAQSSPALLFTAASDAMLGSKILPAYASDVQIFEFTMPQIGLCCCACHACTLYITSAPPSRTVRSPLNATFLNNLTYMLCKLSVFQVIETSDNEVLS